MIFLAVILALVAAGLGAALLRERRRWKYERARNRRLVRLLEIAPPMLLRGPEWDAAMERCQSGVEGYHAMFAVTTRPPRTFKIADGDDGWFAEAGAV